MVGNWRGRLPGSRDTSSICISREGTISGSRQEPAPRRTSDEPRFQDRRDNGRAGSAGHEPRAGADGDCTRDRSGFRRSQCTVDAYDTFSSPLPVAFSRSVPIAGDSDHLRLGRQRGADGRQRGRQSSGGGSANLALTGAGSVLNPLIGFSHYGYSSASGQGLFTVATVGGNTLLSLTALPASSGYDAANTLNAAFLGNWTTDGAGPLQIDAASFALPPKYTVNTNFVYDPTFDTTFFRATAPATPEPGVCALFVGVMAPFAGFAIRRMRRMRRA